MRQCLGAFPGERRDDRSADDDDLDGPRRHRPQHLAEVKAQRRRDVEVEVRVVDTMKAPQKGDDVIQAMPEIRRVVHEHERDGSANEGRQRDKSGHAKPCGLGPHRGDQDERKQHDAHDDHGRNGEGDVRERALEATLRPAPQGVPVLQPQECREVEDKDRRDHEIER